MLAWSGRDTELGAFLFFGGLCVIVACGALYAWRGALTSASLPALSVLLFPEKDFEAPTDRGGCDPFCADPVAGLDDALAFAALGLFLALLGWLLAWLGTTVGRKLATRDRTS